MDSNTKYLGYGFTYTNKDHINVKTTPVYKKLRAACLDDIRLYVGKTIKDERKDLHDYILSLCEGGYVRGNYVIVFPSIESIGTSAPDAGFFAEQLLFRGFGIIVIGRPELSTHDFNGNHYNIDNDTICGRIACAAYGEHGKRKNAIDYQYRLVYWAWQNYYIDTKDAIRLSEMTNATFYLTGSRYRTESSLYDIYSDDQKQFLLLPYHDKPIRGADLDELTSRALISAQRKYGNEFSIEQFSEHMLTQESGMMYNLIDWYREKNKLLYGRGALALATNKYSRGPAYVEFLEQLIGQYKINTNKEKAEINDRQEILRALVNVII